MAKKRKAPKSFNEPRTAKSAKYDVEETFNDSEDDFFAGRDKILLDQSADAKRKQRLIDQERDLQPSDEEILDYQDNITSDDSDDIEGQYDYNDDLPTDKKTSSKLRSRRGEASDEDEDDQSGSEVWGTTREDYYGDDAIETEEQAREEEEEAKRLHLKQLKNMTDADFGFDETEWAVDEKALKQSRPVTEKLPDAQIPEGATPEQKIQILTSRYPEFLPLAEEMIRLQDLKTRLDRIAENIAKEVAKGGILNESLPIEIKRNALNTYLATIPMYFAVLSSTLEEKESTRKITALNPFILHEHTVIQSLARARQLWEQVEHVEHGEITGYRDQHSLDSNGQKISESHSHRSLAKPQKISSDDKLPSTVAEKAEKRASKKQTDTLMNTKLAQKQKNRRSKEAKQRPLKINDLIAQTRNEDDNQTDSENGDEQPLTEEQFAEKAQKRKSLRFYTSQLASKASKRGHASREAGGDDDLPYKERQRDRKERLLRDAENRGKSKLDAADDFGERDGDDYTDLPGQRDANDDYYDTLLDARDRKKADKDARAQAHALAAREGATVYEEETVGPDGKRAITYAIAKNKGLTPKRSKDVRNPRVKKRKKYDEKMKKLGSIRQVYKGGEGRGGYGGELTGIKTNVVKSIKL